MERRSAKSSAARRRYTVDAFEGIDELQDIVSDDEEVGTPVNDFEHRGGDYEDHGEHSPDEEAMSGLDDNLVEDASDGNSDAGEHLLDDSDSIAEDAGENGVASRPLTRIKKRKKEVLAPGPKTYTRAMPDHLDRTWSKEARLLFYYGSSTDFEPVQAALKRWFHQPTLPSRIADVNGLGGMHNNFAVGHDATTTKASDGWKWWSEHGGKDLFLKKQVLDPVAEESIPEYVPEKQADDLPFLMGPYKAQQIYRLPVGGSVALSDAWKLNTLVDGTRDSASQSSSKRGFMLNLGAKVHCVDWVPNQNGRDQYLAAAVLPSRDHTHPPLGAPHAPAFEPQQSRMSNIQIWRFQSDEEGSIRTDVAPHLDLVLCTSWADVKTLKWCPMRTGLSGQTDCNRLGLFAGIWSDGAIRILDASLALDRKETRYLHVKYAAFESRPPATLCTCLAWVSNSRIAAGCANGCIAIWDLPVSLRSTSSNARPTIYSSISTSYVLSIATCYPSRPNMLLAVTMAGHITLTDLSRSGQPLLSPATTISGNRVRVSQPLLIWHDFAQLAIHVEDSFIVKGSTIRRVFANIGLGRAKSNGTSLVGSPCHPFVLVGCANGDVFAMNPLRRVMHGRPAVWQQTWFSHEWRRLSVEELEASGYGNDGARVAGGLSRISEGFKAERTSLVNYDRWSQKYNSHEGTVFTTIYEEASSVTALAWNPNPHVGGWAAAGMGDGLLRVEDIAI